MYVGTTTLDDFLHISLYSPSSGMLARLFKHPAPHRHRHNNRTGSCLHSMRRCKHNELAREEEKGEDLVEQESVNNNNKP